MIETLTLVPALSTGILLGIFYFGGLLYTVRKGLASRHPALWFSSSWLLRMSVVALGFHLISAGHWERILVCAAGFFIARVLINFLAREVKKLHGQKLEADHAPQP